MRHRKPGQGSVNKRCDFLGAADFHSQGKLINQLSFGHLSAGRKIEVCSNKKPLVLDAANPLAVGLPLERNADEIGRKHGVEQTEQDGGKSGKTFS